MREKPYGHIQYWRKDPRTGKLVYVPQKGVKVDKKHKQQQIATIRGELFERLFTKSIENILKNPNAYNNLEQFLEANKQIKEQFDKLSSEWKKVLVYNINTSIKSLKNVLGEKFKDIVSAQYVGRDVGIGKKADVVLKFKENPAVENAYTDMSKIDVFEKGLGISIKTMTGSAHVTLLSSTYKKFGDLFQIDTEKYNFSNPNDRITFLKKFLAQTDEQTIKKNILKNLHKLLEDTRYPDLMLLITDFKENKTYLKKEKEVTEKLKEKLKKATISFSKRETPYGVPVVSVNFKDENDNTIFIIEPRTTRNNISLRVSYKALLELIKSE